MRSFGFCHVLFSDFGLSTVFLAQSFLINIFFFNLPIVIILPNPESCSLRNVGTDFKGQGLGCTSSFMDVLKKSGGEHFNCSCLRSICNVFPFLMISVTGKLQVDLQKVC